MDIETVRARFPALQNEDIYADNAGGTQTLDSVIKHISAYYTSTNAQLGGLYHVSKSSADAVQRGLEAGAAFINAEPSEVVFGSSTTQLFVNLSLALRIHPGDELIVSEMDHEANIAPWHRLAAMSGAKVVPWKVDRQTGELNVADLTALLTPKTRLVTVTHSSNILGTISPVKEIAALVHAHSSAQVVVDGVAFAPHRLVDVKDLGVDFYCFSWYKVYGPHIAMLYASTEAQESLSSLGHYFHTGTDLGTKLGLAGGAYELQSAITCVVDYLRSLVPSSSSSIASPTTTSDSVTYDPSMLQKQLRATFDAIERHEEELQTIVMTYLLSHPDTYRIWGSTSMSGRDRMPLISFTVRGQASSAVVAQVHARSNFGIRNGHMYSKRLLDHLDADDDGSGEYVVRLSLCHYNSVQEATAFVHILESIRTEGV